MIASHRGYYWLQDRIAVRLNGPIQEFLSPPRSRGRVVMDADWDNLIVLDACRADLFEDAIQLDRFDAYEVVESLGSCTPQWTTRNFSNGDYGDTVYVSANAFTAQLASGQFHDVVDVDETMEELDIVHPESIYDVAREMSDRYPNKRFIVHFVQPHMPFIATPELVYRRHRKDRRRGYGGKQDPAHVHEALSSGAISHDEWWHGYRENLLLVFDYAMSMVDALGGKSVITSDHGNMGGERSWPVPIRHYGHPRHLRARPLVRVPWAELTVGDRRECFDDGTTAADAPGEDEIKDRLEALGYRM